MLSLLFLAGSACAAFPDTTSYRTYLPGDMIMSQDRVFLPLYDGNDVSPECAKNMILLKDGYMLSLDRVYEIFGLCQIRQLFRATDVEFNILRNI